MIYKLSINSRASRRGRWFFLSLELAAVSCQCGQPARLGTLMRTRHRHSNRRARLLYANLKSARRIGRASRPPVRALTFVAFSLRSSPGEAWSWTRSVASGVESRPVLRRAWHERKRPVVNQVYPRLVLGAAQDYDPWAAVTRSRWNENDDAA